MNTNDNGLKRLSGLAYISYHGQKGAILTMVLMLLTVLTFLGVSTISATNTEIKIAINKQQQYQVELAADNAMDFLISSYPKNTMSSLTGSNFNGGQANITLTPSIECTDRLWGGTAGTVTPLPEQVSAPSHHTDYETPGKYLWSGIADWKRGHPHLAPGAILLIDGPWFRVGDCGGGWRNSKGGKVFYTGFINLYRGCASNGWVGTPNKSIEVVRKTQAEMDVLKAPQRNGNRANGNSVIYDHMEIKVIAKHNVTGASSTVVKGLKYRWEDNHPNSACAGRADPPANAIGAIETGQILDPGANRVTYSYRVID